MLSRTKKQLVPAFILSLIAIVASLMANPTMVARAAPPVLDIDHEDGLSDYTRLVSGAGRLARSSTAALGGTTSGLAVQVSRRDRIYGEVDFAPVTSPQYRFRLYLDPNGLTMGLRSVLNIANLYGPSTSPRAWVALHRRYGSYQLRLHVRDDAYQAHHSAWHAVSDDEHYVEVLVEYASSSSATDGRATLWIDGQQRDAVSGIDLYDLSKPERLRLGSVWSLRDRTAGTFYLDEFVLRNDGVEIGPSNPSPPGLPTATQTPSPAATQGPDPTATPPPTSSPTPEDMVVDDTDPGFVTDSEQDAWREWESESQEHYGGSHHYNHKIGTGQDVATWSFTVPQPGQYEVFARWWAETWRPTNVPYTVYHQVGSDTIRVNQQLGGRQWNSLGVFAFGNQGAVSVSDDVSSGQGIVADAIRLVYVGPSTTPVPTATATPSPTSQPTHTPSPTSQPTHTPTATATTSPVPTVTPTTPSTDEKLYVAAVGGNDAGPGTRAQPLATLRRALEVAQRGDTIHMLGGEHNLNGARLTISRAITLEGDGTDSVLTNGRGIVIGAGHITIRDLVLRDFAHSSGDDAFLVLQPGAAIDGLVVEGVVFRNGYSGIWGRKFGGSLTHARIANCTFANLISPLSLCVINISGTSAGTVSDIEIVGNTITNVATTNPQRSAYGIIIGLDANTAERVTIRDNIIDGITGGTQQNQSYYAEARGILTYGDYHTISGNEVKNINKAIAHTGIYVKGSHARVTDNFVYRGGSVDDASGDIAIKGNGNIDNVVSGNTILSDEPGGGTVIVTKGEVRITNNRIVHTSARYGIYSYDLSGKHIEVTNNHIEVLGRAVGIYDASSGEYAYNTVIGYVGHPEGTLKRISGNVHVHDNEECLGYECATRAQWDVSSHP